MAILLECDIYDGGLIIRVYVMKHKANNVLTSWYYQIF